MLNLDFFYNVANLKKVSRQGWIDKLSLKNPESVADHCFSMTTMAMALSDHNGLDTERILRMSLLHDLAESLVGDITPESMTKKEKNKLEDKAMKKILASLPEKIQKKYLKIWQEYVLQASKEAKFLHQIDKLEMALQASIYQDKVKKEHLEPFFKSAKKSITDKKLNEILEEITKNVRK